MIRIHLGKRNELVTVLLVHTVCDYFLEIYNFINLFKIGLRLPDGRMRIVRYIADENGKYNF